MLIDELFTFAAPAPEATHGRKKITLRGGDVVAINKNVSGAIQPLPSDRPTETLFIFNYNHMTTTASLIKKIMKIT